MKSKIFSLMIFSILATIMLLGMASAATIFTDDFNDGDLAGWTAGSWTNTGSLAESSNTASDILSRSVSTLGFEDIVVRYGAQTVDTINSFGDGGDSLVVEWSSDGVTFNTLESITTSTALTSKNFNLPSSAENSGNFQIRFTCSSDAASESCGIDNVFIEGVTAPTEILACTANPGELNVKKIDFTNDGMPGGKTFGEDDEWFPLDDIEVQIEVENDGDEDIDDVSIEWGIWDTRNNQWIIDLDEEDEINIKDGDEETLTVSFNLDGDLDVDLDELDDGDNYRFYVKASGTVDDGSDTPTCASDFETADIIIESDFVVLNNFQVDGIDLGDSSKFPDTLQCGTTLQITADVWNVGDKDQDEVSVRIFNSDFGINQILEIGDIDAFDDDKLTFGFTIPEGIDEKTHILEFSVLDEDKDIYENDFDDEKSEFDILLEVKECGSKALVSASLESSQKGEVSVKSTITNTGKKQATYSINAAGFSVWASEASVSPNTLTLGAGESGNVIVTFKVLKGASGDNLFDLEVLSENSLVVSQQIQVPVQSSALEDLLGDNPVVGVLIAAIIIVLAVILIVFLVRLFRR